MMALKIGQWPIYHSNTRKFPNLMGHLKFLWPLCKISPFKQNINSFFTKWIGPILVLSLFAVLDHCRVVFSWICSFVVAGVHLNRDSSYMTDHWEQSVFILQRPTTLSLLELVGKLTYPSWPRGYKTFFNAQLSLAWTLFCS